jgi:thiol-disulfide isomerase/thioredoxin
MSSRVLLALTLLLGAPGVSLAQTPGTPPSQPQTQTPAAAFDQIQAKIPEFRQAQGEQAQRRILEEIHGLASAFLDTHAAAATAEQLNQVAGYWFELAGIFETPEETVRARITQLRALPALSPELGNALTAMEAKLNLKPGADAPGWTATDIHDGSEVTLQSLRGKYVLMDFWATWCGPCRQLMQDKLAPLHARYGADERFLLVGIGLPWNDETAEKEKEFGERSGYRWKKVFDAAGASAGAYGVDGIPFLCLADTDGKILVVGSGWDVIEEIEAALRERLGPGQEPAAPPTTTEEAPAPRPGSHR